jgi:hypothetical protein
MTKEERELLMLIGSISYKAFSWATAQMSETSFTPAPWVAKDDDPCRIIRKEGRREVIIAVTAINDVSLETCLANARLICKAPELLAALDHLIESRCDLCKAHVSIETCKECWMVEYKQLLARAKGEDERESKLEESKARTLAKELATKFYENGQFANQ